MTRDLLDVFGRAPARAGVFLDFDGVLADIAPEPDAAVIREGADDGSLPAHSDPHMLATTLYQIWLGASLMGALSRDTIPYDGAMTATAALLDNKGHA